MDQNIKYWARMCESTLEEADKIVRHPRFTDNGKDSDWSRGDSLDDKINSRGEIDEYVQDDKQFCSIYEDIKEMVEYLNKSDFYKNISIIGNSENVRFRGLNSIQRIFNSFENDKEELENWLDEYNEKYKECLKNVKSNYRISQSNYDLMKRNHWRNDNEKDRIDKIDDQGRVVDDED